MMRPTPLPQTLKRARFATLVLAPASLLPFKTAWQQIANVLPAGSTLIILPVPGSPHSEALERIAASFEARGWSVKILPASEITGVPRLGLQVG